MTGTSTQRTDGGRRVLPHNADAEAAILGGIILQYGVLDQLDTLKVDHFYAFQHRVVFEAMRNLQQAQRPVDVVTLEVEIEKGGKLAAIGGVAFLGELTLRVPTIDNVIAYADEVKLLWRHRQAQLILSSSLERVQNWPHDPYELVSEVGAELMRLEQDHASEQHSTKSRWVVPLSTFLGDAEPDDDDSVDWVIRDLIPRGEPCLFAGPQKGGKTWAALDLLIAIALGEDWLGGKFGNTLGGPARVLGIFREDNQRRLTKRLWELAGGRNRSPRDPLLLEHLSVSRTPLRLPDAQDQRRLIAEMRAWKPAVCLIDNLTRIMLGDPNTTRDAAAFTRAWTEIGEEVGCAVVFLHHTKKPGGGDRKDVDPFDEIRGSSDFAAAARNIIVSRPIPHDTEKVSDVRMRGNLDLRVESFALGFERFVGPLGRYVAKLVDRGDVDDLREQVSKSRKDDKEDKKARERDELYNQRKNLALELAHKEGCVTQRRLAYACGLSSERTLGAVFERMVAERLLDRAGKQGYVLAGTSQQGEIPA